MKGDKVRIAEDFRPFSVRLTFETVAEAKTWMMRVLDPLEDVVGVPELAVMVREELQK